MLPVGRLEDHVEAGLERVLRGDGRVRLGHVQHGRAAGRGRVGDHESRESPVPLQHGPSGGGDSASPADPSTEL